MNITNVLNDKDVVVLPAGNGIATSREPEEDDCQAALHDLNASRGKRYIFYKHHIPQDYRGSQIITTGSFCRELGPDMGQMERLSSISMSTAALLVAKSKSREHPSEKCLYDGIQEEYYWLIWGTT